MADKQKPRGSRMANLMYLFGVIGVIGSVFAFLNAPVLMGGPVIGAFVGSILLLGLGRLLELTDFIERNTRDTAEQLRQLINRDPR